MALLRNQIVFFTCLILVSITPLISCRPENESDRTDVANIAKINDSSLQLKEQSLERLSGANLPRISPSTNDDNEKYDRNSEINRKKSRNRTKFVSNSKKSQLKRNENVNVVQKRPSNFKYIESEKKYFDYFPIEDVQLKYDPNEDNIRFILLSPEDLEKKKSKSKKFGRHSKRRESGRSKRDVSEQKVLEDASTTSTRKNKRNLFYAYQNPQGFYAPSWNTRVFLPNNFPYQPVQQPSSTYLPARKSEPVRGTYHNALSPEINFVQQPLASGVASRFGEDRYIWGISYQPASNSNKVVDPSGYKSTTRRPQPEYKPTTKGPRPEQSPVPPLIHGPRDNYHDDEYDDEDPLGSAPGETNRNRLGGGNSRSF